jgi:hypothetical protein
MEKSYGAVSESRQRASGALPDARAISNPRTRSSSSGLIARRIYPLKETGQGSFNFGFLICDFRLQASLTVALLFAVFNRKSAIANSKVLVV